MNQFKVYIEYAKDFPFNMETLSTIESQYIQTKELIDKVCLISYVFAYFSKFESTDKFFFHFLPII